MANFAQLGIEIESKDAVTAATNLDSMAAAGKRAEKVTDDLKKSTTDWSAEQAKANARAAEMASQEARREAGLKKSNTAIRDQQQELAKLLGAIDPAVAALGRLDEQERKLAQFRKQGAIDSETFAQYNKRLQDQRNILGGVADAQGKAGMSARAYSAAMRNVPAQITDITTSLISGQPAYLVAIQQGGQLKDMFGGIGPAARALTSSLVSMINPVTILAAVVGTLGVAWYQASKRTESINEALISTGRYAASSAEEIKAMAASMDSIAGITGGAAIDVLNKLAAGGRVSADALQISAEASARWAAVSGQGADTVIEKFNAIAKDPLNALTRLNEAEHFLTETQYQRIKALQDEGKWQEAATEAARIYADTVNGRAREIEQNLGLISTAWLNIKSTSSEAWDAMVTGIDRGMGPLQRFADKLAEIGGLGREASLYGIGLLNPAAALLTRFGGNANRGGPEVIMPGVDGETRTPEAARNESAAARAKAAADAWRQTLAATDKVLSQEIEIERIKDRGKAAGIAQADIDKQIAAYKEQQLTSVIKTASVARTRIPQLTEEQKAAQALARSYESITSQMERQLALSDDNSSLGRVNYEISSGSLRGLGADEQAKIRNLAITQDAVDDYEAIYGKGFDTIVDKTKTSTDLMTEYGIQAARNMQSSFADFLFDPFEDGLGGMAKSFAKTLQRMAAEAAAAQIFKSIGGWASGYTGAGSSWINMIGGLIAGGKADGGYTGPGGKYEPRGIVHAGEVVWSQRDVAAVGGPRAANAMRPTAGYANGGGPGLPASRGMQSSAAPQVIFNITTENGNTNVTQQGAAESLGRELESVVVPIIYKWYAQNSRPGGAVYNGRMGTA